MVIVMSFLTFIFTIIRTTQQYKLKKFEQQSGGKSGDSLTTSELREMIEDAVVGATEPMKDDIESLAMRLDQIQGGGERVLLEDEADIQEKTVGRPVRQRQRQR